MAALPLKCRRYLTERDIRFDESEEGGQKAVILRAMTLPAGRFDAAVAEFTKAAESQCPGCGKGTVVDTDWGWRCTSCEQYDVAVGCVGP